MDHVFKGNFDYTVRPHLSLFHVYMNYINIVKIYLLNIIYYI